MNTLNLVTTTDGQGNLSLNVPVALRHQRVQVLVVWEALSPEASEAEVDQKANKRAELEALAGSLQDDPIQRFEQGNLEQREPVL